MRRALLAALLACGPPPAGDPPAPASPPASPPAPAPPPAPPEPLDPTLAGLAARAVHHDAFARPILYTWTTGEQAAALRASRRLLVADAAAGEPSPFIRALRRLAPTDRFAALLLDHPGLARRRYAWPSPFATVRGLRERSYGDVLVRIELAPDALLVRFRPSDPTPFAAFDLSGKPVDLAAAAPDRLAAVYHVRDAAGDDPPFREYVVISESQVAAWSLSTPEIAADVAAELALLDALRTGPFGHLPAAAVAEPAAPAWPTAPARPSALDRWHAALAFDNRKYRPIPADLAAIAAALRARAGGEPLTVRPDMTFPAGPQGQQSAHAGR